MKSITEHGLRSRDHRRGRIRPKNVAITLCALLVPVAAASGETRIENRTRFDLWFATANVIDPSGITPLTGNLTRPPAPLQMKAWGWKKLPARGHVRVTNWSYGLVAAFNNGTVCIVPIENGHSKRRRYVKESKYYFPVSRTGFSVALRVNATSNQSSRQKTAIQSAGYQPRKFYQLSHFDPNIVGGFAEERERLERFFRPQR